MTGINIADDDCSVRCRYILVSILDIKHVKKDMQMPSSHPYILHQQRGNNSSDKVAFGRVGGKVVHEDLGNV